MTGEDLKSIILPIVQRYVRDDRHNQELLSQPKSTAERLTDSIVKKLSEPLIAQFRPNRSQPNSPFAVRAANSLTINTLRDIIPPKGRKKLHT